jgi:hypothetical protein
MRKTVLILACLFPAALAAQSIVTVSPQQCVWRAGDDPSWAAPNLNDSTWQPYAQWTQPDQPHYWVRCHADLSPLQGLAHPAIQLTLYAAYQFYLDGELIGEAGNLRSGNYSLNSIQRFPAPASNHLTQPATIAVRLTYRYADPWVAASDRSIPVLQTGSSVTIEAGDSAVLQGRRANEILAQIPDPLINLICLGAIGVLGLVLLAQFFQDRSRRDLLFLSLTAVATAVVNARLFCVAALCDLPVWANAGLYASAVLVIVFTQPVFSFAVAGKRVPLVFWILVVFSLLRNVLQGIALFLSPAHSLALEASVTASTWVRSLSYAAIAAAAFAPFVAFWPYRNITRRMMPLAALCMAWGATMVHYYVTDVLLINSTALAHMFPGAQQVVIAWHSAASHAFTVVSACVLIVLMGLLSRDQQRTARERAELAGEMQSAREIQRYLIPEKLPPTPGLAIRSVYQPSREVGGDFFQVLPDPRDGSTLIVVGDVAGKGLKAGMLAALIVGATRTAFKFTSDPGSILALLNERLQGRGLVTCLAMRIDRNGSVELANAGQLPPYINGKELELEGAFPLGAMPDVSFPSQHFQLSAGESMLLVSDGVVEARNTQGELFGFERTRAISTESAQNIASAAQRFGQDDDITVLTLTLAPAEVLHA